MDFECLYFTIDKDDLLENLESIYIVVTQSSSHREQSTSMDYRDSKQERNTIIESNQALLAHH